MAIQLEEATTAGTPVLKRKQIGEQFAGAVIKFEMRQIVKDGKPQVKDNGKPRNELVVYLQTVSSTMRAGLGDSIAVPAAGTIVRAILKGGAFGQWIESKNQLGRPVQVGDLFTMDTTHAEIYQGVGSPTGQKLTTDDEATAFLSDPTKRDLTVAWRGNLALRAAGAEHDAIVRAAEAAYMSLKDSIQLEEPSAPATPQGDPFATPPPVTPAAAPVAVEQAAPSVPAPAPAADPFAGLG